MQLFLRIASLCAVLALVSACAYETPIQRYSDSKSKFNPPTAQISNNIPDKYKYRFFNQGATGYVPVSSCVRYAEEKAENFCRRLDREMILLGQSTSNPIPYPGNFPKCEIIFAALSKEDVKKYLD